MARSKDPTDTAPAAAAASRLRMRVEGMTCTGCEHHVEQALREAGATDVEADFRRGEAGFTVSGAPDEARLRAAVEETGYRPGTIEPISAASGPSCGSTDCRSMV